MDWSSLFGEDSSFTNLSNNEKDILKKIMLEEASRRERASKSEQIREVVPIDKWLESEYYVGPDCVRVYDYWKQLIYDVFDPKRTKDNRINEIVISGAIGVGKSTVSELILMRRLYELSCYKNINALFELMLKTHITFLYFSINKVQAERTGYGEMMSWLDSSPYFNECFERNKNINSLMVFPENVILAFGSGTQDSIGMSVMGSILDEANFFKGNDSNDSNRVGELYASIVNRSNSRFIIKGGENYSLNILVSSSTHESSFTEKRIEQSRGNPHVLVRCPTQWEVKPGKFSGKFFYVCKGTNFLDPFIVRNIDDVNNYKLSEGMMKCKVDSNLEDQDMIDKEIGSLPDFKRSDFISVPTDLRNGFETNIIKSLQDMGGVSVAPTGRLFTSKPVYMSNCKSYLKHPFINDSVVISTGDDVKIQDYLRDDFVFQYPSRPRYLHIDQSTTTDSTGIASVYIKDIIEVDNLKKSIVGVDFMLRIEPPKPPKKIAIYKIRDFVVYLNVVRGLKLGKVTYDIFNSEESRQILEEMGYNVGYLSVDRTDKAYVDLVTMLYEERMELYDYEPFREELFSVIHDRRRRKVDHPREMGLGELGTGKRGCFLGSTKIKLLDGTNRSIDELVGKDGIELYGCMESGKIVPVVAKKIFKTKEVDRYVKVTLDNGEVVECTEDHRFMLRDGSYKEVRDLSIEDSLMPLRYDFNGRFLPGYERVWDNFSGRWRYTHTLVAEFYEKVIPYGYVTHQYNHKIVSIEFVYGKNVPVYDIEVPETNNFALTAGIFVHNSKDVSDAVAGAVHNVLSTSFVENSVGDGIGDFLRANSGYSYMDSFDGFSRKVSVEEMVDKEIDRMLGEFGF
jgi:hypothetical protein